LGGHAEYVLDNSEIIRIIVERGHRSANIQRATNLAGIAWITNTAPDKFHERFLMLNRISQNEVVGKAEKQ
jgi:hypothetical protein